ncbi:MAG TPA: hypothetical protein VD926_01710 [Acidimicrobiales bacterium]|nr:hypothetical protein [Acidimicrobiales bacterium]
MRRTIATVAVAALVALVAAVSSSPTASAQLPELNLDITIDPIFGPPGTTIHASVDPAQAQQECIADPVSRLTQILTELAAGGAPDFDPIDQTFLTALAAGLQSGAIPFDIGLLYVGVFADIATQAPVPGSDQPMWDPFQGEVDIVAPVAAPGTYAVVMICFGLNEDPDPAAIADALQGFSDVSDQEELEAAAQAVIPLLIDQDDPLGTGVELFCLDNQAGTSCQPDAGPADPEPTQPPAIAVPGNPAFTG